MNLQTLQCLRATRGLCPSFDDMINYVLLSCSVWIPPPFLLSIESNPLGTFAFYFLLGDFGLWGWIGDVGAEEIVCFGSSNIQTV